ncbi:PAS domain S-box protein [Methanocalculus sp.]|uniref:PAS domain S-box protein n=1 Tax=Methanocalculus sp. TaxID=2004547 RepID=UPI0027292C49|nr:PAS domain S-box protein [Methanocalculus sp.]MDO8841992.1 PAS domain S-box protein [Methanocalculus sp.]
MAHPFPLPKKDYPSLCPLTGMGPGNHLCCIYRTDEEHRAVITQCIRCGLERNEKVLSIVDSRFKDLIPGYIREDGIDPKPYLQSGQLEIETVQESYLRDGVFDPDAVIRQLAASTDAAVQEGYSALRVINEMALVPGNLPERARLIEYETLLNTFLPGSRCLMVCLYDRQRVPSDILLDLLMTHPYAVIGTELIENLSFIQSDEFITKDRWSVLLDHWIENLKERNRLIRTLTHEKEIVETYLDVAGVMMVALDTKGTVMMANQKTLDLLGFPKSDLIGENWFDRAIPKHLREEVRLVHSRLIVQDEGADLFFDNPVLTKEGEERIIAWYNTLLRDDTGLVIGTLSSGEDVTELRTAEAERKKEHEALLESEHRLSDIIDFLPDATFAIDKKGVVIAWNHAIEEMTGVSAEEMIGQGEYAYALPFYGKRQPMLIDLAFKDDLTLRSRYDLLKEMPDVIEAETRYARPRGEERMLWGRVSPLHDRQGQNVGAIETIRDMTDRKHAEAALQLSESLKHHILAAVPDILIRCNGEGRYLDILTPDDDRFILPKADLIGRTITEVTSEEIGSLLTEAIRLALSSKEMQTVEYTLGVPAGNLHFEARIVPYSEDEVIALIRDITDRKEAEDALHERIKELSCLYRISATIEHFSLSEEEVLRRVADLIPEGFRHPELTRARITLDDTDYSSTGYQMTPWSINRDIIAHQRPVGAITVYFIDEYVITAEESVLLRNCAEQIGRYIERIRSVALLQQKNEELATAEEELRSQLEDLVATQQQLRESEAYIRTVLDNLPIGIAVNSVDPEVNFDYFNENFFRIYRTTAEALQRADAFWDVVYEDPKFRSELRERVLADGISGDPDRMQWEDIPITRKGEETTYISARNIPVPGKDLVISTVWDVTGRVEAQARVRLHLIRVQHLLNLHRMTDATEPEIFNSTLDAGLAMVESRYAFIGMIGGDESEMIIHAWSQDTMEDCTVIDKPMHFPIASAGIWGECVRNRKPAVFNEYAAPHPAKHGYPEGHVPITRYLGVPIFDGSRIVAVLAVANKESEYRDDDIDALMTLGNAMWGLIHRRRFDAVLRESEERYRSVSTLISDFAYSCVREDGGEYRIDWMVGAIDRISGYEIDEVIAEGCWGFLVHPDDRRIFEEEILSLAPGASSDCELRIVRRDGGIRWLRAVTRSALDESGRSRIYGGCRDVTEEKTALLELEMSHARLESAMEAGGIAWWEMDSVTGDVAFSPRKAEMLGYSPDRFSHYTDFTDLIHPEDKEKAMQAMRDHLEGRAERYEAEYRIKNSAGTYLWFRDLGSVSDLGEGGAPLKVVGLVMNITTLKEADEALRQSEKRFKTLFMDSPVSIIIHDRDTGEIIDANPEACLSYGCSSVEELKSYNFWLESPYSFEDALNYIRKAASEGPQEFEWLNRSVTGVLFYEQVRLSSVVISGVERILATSIDITKRKEAEIALRESEALLSSAGRITHFGGWSINLDEQKVIWSDEVARIHGMDPGYSPSIDEGISFYAPEWKEKISSVFQECLRNGISYDEEMEIINATGERRWVRTTGEAVTDESGEIVGIHGAFQDITKRKMTEEAWKKAYAQIEENMYKFSILNDQIRNPLAVIMALVDLEGGEYADRIIEQVRLIDRIIAFLDQGVLESESTRAFMRKHDQLSS